MNLQQNTNRITGIKNLELLAHQIVEGFISGMHKSPFHGFSAEFAEHKIYNSGESTKNIDWKLFARTDRLYTKQYEEETNMRCHIIIDNSSSMHYPIVKQHETYLENKIGFSVLTASVLLQLLKRQRDAAGLSIYSDTYEFYTGEKGSDKHFRMLFDVLEKTLKNPVQSKKTKSTEFLHQIAENIHRRSMVILFTDFFEDTNEKELFEALKHLKYNKHKVVLFHVHDAEKEGLLHFGNQPKKFIDVETGETIQLFPEQIQQEYAQKVSDFFKRTELLCAQYHIKYVKAPIQSSFENIITTYLTERQKFR